MAEKLPKTAKRLKELEAARASEPLELLSAAGDRPLGTDPSEPPVVAAPASASSAALPVVAAPASASSAVLPATAAPASSSSDLLPATAPSQQAATRAAAFSAATRFREAMACLLSYAADMESPNTTISA